MGAEAVKRCSSPTTEELPRRKLLWRRRQAWYCFTNMVITACLLVTP